MHKRFFFRTLAVAVFMLATVITPSTTKAQLTITTGSSLSNWTPDSLVRNVLLGEGVDVYNVKFNGSLTSINCTGVGKFTTGTTPTNLGISEGLVLSASGMDYITTTSGSATSNCSNYSDASLTALTSPYAANNVALLEFDFIPKSDSIKFRYVFASEEYYGYECSQYNDAFAFFLTGIDPRPENPTGMYTDSNIALIPNTRTPITINTVNGGQSHGSTTPCILTNTQYFVNNQSMTYVHHMDGFTTVLTAEAKVVPCQTYHLKMAVCNVSDNSLPSAVFLEANSLSSNALQFSFENPSNPETPSDLYEGCMATIHIHRPSLSSVPTNIGVEFMGEAVNGHDFPQINNSFTFPADTQDMSITIMPTLDGTAEGTDGREFVKFRMSPANGCPRSDSVEFYIVDTDPMQVFIDRDTIHCASSNVVLRSRIEGGMPNRQYAWYKAGQPNVLATTPNYTVFPIPDSADYVLEVSDFCGNYGYDTITIGVRREFALQPPDTMFCQGLPLVLEMRGADSCVWNIIGQEPFEMQDTSVSLHPEGITTFAVRSYIWWNGQIWEDLDTIRTIGIPTPDVSVSVSTERLCEGQSVTFTATGASEYSWDDSVSFVTTNTFTYMPDTTTQYIIYGLAQGAECVGRDTVVITVDTIPDVIITGGGGVCDGEEVHISVATTAEFFMWVAMPSDPSLTGQEQHNNIIVNPLETTVYTVNAQNGVCSNSSQTTVPVELSPVAIGEVSPRTVSLGSMEAVFTNRSEHATTCKWEFPDGTEKTEDQVTYVVPDDVDSINVRLWAYNPYMCFDTTTITVYVDHTTMWVPNAFTPEESTNNTFLVKMNDVQRYHILIYDRRGQLVFESFDPEKPWDGNLQNGKKCPQGVYTYVVTAHKITYPFDQLLYRGTVVLIR